MKASRTWSLASDFKQLDLLIGEACSFLQQHSVPSDSELFGFELCLREALNNAVVHGNEAVPDSVGCLTISMLQHSVEVQIRYNGPSFELPAWAFESADLLENGRGFRILLNFCRQVFYDSRRNSLNFSLLLQKMILPQGQMSMMSRDDDPAFRVLRSDDRIVLLLELDLIASNVQTIKTQLLETLAECTGAVVFDLSKVRMVDSSGISVLIATYNSLKTKKQEFIVAGVSGDIQQLLCAMRLDRHFKVVPGPPKS